MKHHPSILEINTCVWLDQIGHGLDQLTAADFESLGGRDYLWLMGIWERSVVGRLIAQTLPGLQSEYQVALPDYTPEDIIGSAYAIRAYRVDPRLGSDRGLERVRSLLNERFGTGLIVDFIPNHCAIDSPWTAEHPDWFVPCLNRRGDECFSVGGRTLAHGRDPYFPSWTDTAQYDFANSQTRRALIDQLLSVASRADGVRCDMAMLMLREVFTHTWGRDPLVEFWADAIAAVKARYPDFVFIAEAYWGLEWQLMQLGFDFCYDKTLYDRLTHRDAVAVAEHLRAERGFSDRLVRFAENHDEQPALRAFGPGWWAATLISATVPGAHLEYLGQGERTTRVPVQLGRFPGYGHPSREARQFLAQLANFRRTLADEFEVHPCPHPQVISYRRGMYEFFVNLSGQGVQMSSGDGVLRLPPYGATILQPIHQAPLPVPIDWLHQLVAVA